jgi:hypothetical protein
MKAVEDGNEQKINPEEFLEKKIARSVMIETEMSRIKSPKKK